MSGIKLRDKKAIISLLAIRQNGGSLNVHINSDQHLIFDWACLNWNGYKELEEWFYALLPRFLSDSSALFKCPGMTSSKICIKTAVLKFKDRSVFYGIEYHLGKGYLLFLRVFPISVDEFLDHIHQDSFLNVDMSHNIMYSASYIKLGLMKRELIFNERKFKVSIS